MTKNGLNSCEIGEVQRTNHVYQFDITELIENLVILQTRKFISTINI